MRSFALAGAGSTMVKRVELVVLRLDSGERRLAYTSVVAGEAGVARIFVDASAGIELLRISEIQTQAAVGNGTGVLGDRKKLSVRAQAGTYVADDQHRPPVLTTYDMRANLGRTSLVVERGAAFVASEIASDTDNEWTDVAQVDAHAHIEWTYDYLFKRFGRRGLDDRDRLLTIVTNAVSQHSGTEVEVPAADGRTQKVKVGGFQAGGGLRVRF